MAVLLRDGEASISDVASPSCAYHTFRDGVPRAYLSTDFVWFSSRVSANSMQAESNHTFVSSVHSVMGPTQLIRCPLCWCILYSIRCTGRLGCRAYLPSMLPTWLTYSPIIIDSNSTRWDVPTSIQSNVPRCCLPDRKCKPSKYHPRVVVNVYL